MSNQNRRAQLRAQQEAKARAQRNNRIIGFSVLGVAAVLAIVFGVVLFQQFSANTASAVPPNATSDKSGIVVNPGKAKSGAPTVDLYFDYQCPVCKTFETAHGEELLQLTGSGEIQLQYKTMTFLDAKLRNDSSIRSGVAAACADSVGKYSAFHDAIFAAQPAREGDGYPAELLRTTIPAAVGITGEALTKFQQCYDTRATSDFVKGTQNAAVKAEVQGTPTMRVNGKDVPFASFMNATSLSAIINQYR